MTDQCRTNFYVNPSDSVVAIMDDDAPTGRMNVMGASLVFPETEVPEALLHHSDFNESWLNRTTLVYADEVMPLFVNSNLNWFRGDAINPQLHTWPKPSNTKVLLTAITTLFKFVVLVGPNVYSNRWCGWGSLLLPVALLMSFDAPRMQVRDLKFCKLDCLNDYGGIFVVPEDVPKTILIAVYQNGTCDNWYQARHSRTSIPGTTQQETNLINLWPGTSCYSALFSEQPYSGCFTWRRRIEVKTENIQVLDYAHLAATAGTFRRVVIFS